MACGTRAHLLRQLAGICRAACRSIAATVLGGAISSGADGTCPHLLDAQAIAMRVPLDPYFEVGLAYGGGQHFDQ